ncbi:MAG TPA: hypothetical protein VH855_19035 [Acetobacteraceae bacterium]|jgi:hypothetical protein
MHFLPRLLVALALLSAASAVWAQPQAVTDLPRATTCSAKSSMAVPGGNVGTSEITMSSDGGWCWINLWATQGSMQYAPKYRVAQPPAHGELAMGEVDKKARIAYRPVPGFVGQDTYTLMNTMSNSERRVTISVVK